MNDVMGLICANYNTDRLGALTEDRPLASAPFGGRYRLMDFVLSNLVNAGVRTVGIIMPYMYRSMMDHLGAGKDWFLDRKRGGLFILPGSVYGFNNMSTQFLVKDMIKNKDYLVRDEKEYIIIATANQVYNMDYIGLIKAHAESGADITLVYRNRALHEERSGYFLELSAKNRVVNIVSAKTRNDTGEGAPDALFADCLIMGRQKLVDLIGWYQVVDYMDLMDVIGENLGLLSVRGYEFSGYLGRVESIEAYMRCSLEILSPEVHEELFFGDRPVYTKIKDGVPTRYISRSEVSNCLIPNECTIRGRVENSIIFPSVVVESGAVIKNSVIMQRAVVEENATVENVIADKFVIIGKNLMIRGNAERPLVLKKKNIM
jgi:glucose-1-phosphate adenylyltransferase